MLLVLFLERFEKVSESKELDLKLCPPSSQIRLSRTSFPNFCLRTLSYRLTFLM